MTDLTEFHLFSQLPSELRFMIWERVPFPERVVTLSSPSSLYSTLNSADQIDIRTAATQATSFTARHGCHFRYIVQPREHTLFAPMYANRESRRVWSQKLWQPNRRQEYATADRVRCTVKFDTPYINYDTDIFTMLFLWDSVTRGDRNPSMETAQDPLDPFLGLNRDRIKNVGIGELGWDLEQACLALCIEKLPKLQTLSIVSLGPSAVSSSIIQAGQDHRLGPFPISEMALGEVPSLDCELRNVNADGLKNHGLFNGDGRLHALHGRSFSNLSILRFRTHLKAWLFHAEKVAYNRREAQEAHAVWWAFSDYLEDESKDDFGCPLPFPCCGKDGHSREEVKEWRKDVEVRHKFLCATRWRREMDDLHIFE